jgi:hypothetical protein
VNIDTGEFRALIAGAPRHGSEEPPAWIKARNQANELLGRLDTLVASGEPAADGQAAGTLAWSFRAFATRVLPDLALSKAMLDDAYREGWLDAYGDGFREGRGGRHARPRGGRHERGHLRLVSGGGE